MSESSGVKQAVAGVFDRAASTYDQTGVDFFGAVGRELVDVADPRPGEWVLDLGCGLGASTLLAAERAQPGGRVPTEEQGPKRPGEDGPFSGVEVMGRCLSEAGYVDVRTDLRELTVVYPDEATWWRTLWSHGRRATMERLQEAGVVDSTMRRMSADLDGVRRSDGSLEWTAEMAYTVARV
ncbi:MAG TPA: hypothetical protein VF165_23540 [Nocardioidaceae bacterium]